MSVLIANDAFLLTQTAHPKQPAVHLYIYQLLPNENAQQYHMDLLANSLDLICNNTSGSSAVIIDCSFVTKKGLVKQFLKLCFKDVIDIEIADRAGLVKMLIVTTSGLVKTMSNGIIKLKRADKYTKVCSSMAEAMAEL
jgi:hypothetical protein